MSYNSGGMHKRPYDSAPYQGSVGFIGVGVDTKRSRPDRSGGSGDGGGAAVYGLSGSSAGACSTGAFPRQHGKEACLTFRRTGTCKFGSRCNYDHPPEAHPSNSGGRVSPEVIPSTARRSTSGTPQLLQQGQKQQPRQPPPQLSQNQSQSQQLQQQSYGQQLQQQHQLVGYPGQPQPQSATQASPGQQRFSLPPMPGGAETGDGYTRSSYGSVSGVGGNNSSAPSTPSIAQPLVPPHFSAGPPLLAMIAAVKNPPSTAPAREPGGYETTAQPIMSSYSRAGGPAAQAPPGVVSAQANETKPVLSTLASVDAATSCTAPPSDARAAASAGSWIYDRTTGGYTMAPPPTAPVISMAGTPVQSYQQQHTAAVYGVRADYHPTVAYSGGQAAAAGGGGYNGATARYGQGSVGAAPTATTATLPPAPASRSCGRQALQPQQQRQQTESSSMSATGIADSSGYNLTAGQYPASSEVAAQPATGSSSVPPTTAGLGYGVLSPSVASPSGYSPQGIPSGHGVPLRASPHPLHGIQSQAASSPHEYASTAVMSSATSASGGTTAQGDISTHGAGSSTGAGLQQEYSMKASGSPAPTVERFGVTGSTGNAHSSSHYGTSGVHSSSPSHSGQTIAGATRGVHQSTSAMSATAPTSVPSQQVKAVSAPQATNGNPPPVPATTASSAFTSIPGSAMKPLASSTTSRGGCVSAKAGVLPPPASASATAFATSASKNGSMSSAAAVYGAQQEVAVAATSVGSAAIDSPGRGSIHAAEGGVSGCMPPTGCFGTAGSQNRVPATAPRAGQYVQPWQQPQLPPGQQVSQTRQQQQGAPGGPGVALQSPPVGYSGYGHTTHGVAPQQPPPHQQHQPVFRPGLPSYFPQAGSQYPGGLVGPRGSAAPEEPAGPHAFNGGGPLHFPNNCAGPGQHGPPPPHNMPRGMIGGLGMMGGPGMMGAPVPLNMTSGLMGPCGLVGSGGPSGVRHCGPGGNLGVMHGGSGVTGGPGVLQAQPPPPCSAECPAPNMPQRPAMPDCHSFVKSGSCRFALACKYNHPYDRVGMDFDDSPGIVVAHDRAPCDVYLNAGACTFGDKCRFRHITRGQLAKETAQGISHPDPNQLPKRPGHPSCGFYARTGKCAFGMKCRFDHPTHQNPPAGVYSSTIAKSGTVFSPRAGVTVRAPAPSPEPKTQTKNPTEVTARHILVKHKMSRRPASWQDPTGMAIKQRTPAQATAMLQGLHGSIKTQDDFSKVAMTKSDCSSAKRGGDLGSFSRGKMQRAFEDAAFGLMVGGVSGIVSTDSGVHLIMRTA